MRRIRYDLQAIEDVDAITTYLAQHDSAAAARFIGAFFETAEWLADAPIRAARLEIDGVDPDLRKWQIRGFSNYLLLHLVGDDVLRVVRVVDGRRDLPNVLTGG